MRVWNTAICQPAASLAGSWHVPDSYQRLADKFWNSRDDDRFVYPRNILKTGFQFQEYEGPQDTNNVDNTVTSVMCSQWKTRVMKGRNPSSNQKSDFIV